MSTEIKLGEYIYMGMGRCNGHTVCMSVAYKLDYAVKKALQFERALKQHEALKDMSPTIFYKVNKVKVGELEAETSFSRAELAEYEKRFV